MSEAAPLSASPQVAETRSAPPEPESADSPGFQARSLFVQSIVARGDLFDFKALVEAIVIAAMSAAKSNRVVIVMHDHLHDELEVVRDFDMAGQPRLAAGVRVTLDRWIDAKTAIEIGRPVAFETRETAFELTPSGEGETRPSMQQIMIPIASADERLGLIVLMQSDDHRIPARQLESFADFGRQAGTMLASSRLIDRGRRQAATHRALSKVSQAAISINDQATVLREIAQAALSVMDCDSVSIGIWSRDQDEMEMVARVVPVNRREFGRPIGRFSLRDHRSLNFVLEQQTPVQLQPQQVALTKVEHEWLTFERAESLLLVPLVIAGDTLGVLSFASGKSRAFDADALSFAEEVAAQTALAIQHARYVERTKRQADEQAAMLRVSKAVIAGQNLGEMLTQIAKAALGFEGIDGCRILLWQSGSEQVEIAAEENIAEWMTYYQPGATYPLADWPSMMQVMSNGQPRVFLVTDPEISTRERTNHVADGVRSVAAVPIMAGDECFGCIAFHSRHGRRFTQDTIRVGRELATQAAHAIDRARLYGQLRARAETDGLTGLLNHRAAFETLDRVLATARVDEAGAGVVVLDLDDFKLFNDTHGHLVGDRVLVEVARVLNDTARQKDLVARIGGDEFLLILPGASPDISRNIGVRLVNRMAQTTVTVDSLKLPIRFSVGVASFPNDGKNRQELIAFADSSMYSAKELGGGQVGTIERGTRSLEVSTLGALSGLVRAVDRKDRYTKEHSDLVAEYAVRFGRSLRLSPEKIEALDLAGQLHDVGKIAVPDSILRKPGYLSLEEEAMIRQHVVFSELMIKGVPQLDDVLAAVANHHERWDGTGYPLGRKGTQIPLLGRILALADSLAAMTADRPYRKGRSLEHAVDEIRNGAGKQFDPDLVESFVASVTTGTAILRESGRRKVNDSTELRGTGFTKGPRTLTSRITGDSGTGRDSIINLDLPLP